MGIHGLSRRAWITMLGGAFKSLLLGEPLVEFLDLLLLRVDDPLRHRAHLGVFAAFQFHLGQPAVDEWFSATPLVQYIQTSCTAHKRY